MTTETGKHVSGDREADLRASKEVILDLSQLVTYGISVIALGISVLGFRRNSSAAHIVNGYGDANPAVWSHSQLVDCLLVRIPLLFQNDGANDGVVTKMRLIPPDAFRADGKMWLHMLPEQLDPASGGPFAYPIVVRGHSVELVYAEFKSEPVDRNPNLPTDDYEFRVEIQTARHPAWRHFWTFSIRVDERALRGIDRPSLHLNRAADDERPTWELRG